MKRRYSKLFDKILPQPKRFSWKLRDIKDIEKLELIYICDQWHEHITMVNLIREYGEFEFFRDLLIYLRHHSSGFPEPDKRVTSYYEHFQEIYYDKFNIELV